MRKFGKAILWTLTVLLLPMAAAADGFGDAAILRRHRKVHRLSGRAGSPMETDGHVARSCQIVAEGRMLLDALADVVDRVGGKARKVRQRLQRLRPHARLRPSRAGLRT